MNTSNKTFFQTTKQAEEGRKWLIVDATNKTVGRLATEVAYLIRGKHKPTFTPHNDGGDFVVVVNASKITFTGKKMQEKLYIHHTGYIGGLKEITAQKQLEKNPERIIRQAVEGMLPKGPLGRSLGKKLKVYSGPNHDNVAQKPEVFELRHC